MAIASQERHIQTVDLKKRATLRWLRDGALGIGALALSYGIDRIGLPLYEQHNMWTEVNCPADTFLKNNKGLLQRMKFGANIIPDYLLNPLACDPQIVMDTLKDQFNCSQIRLGTSWSTYDTYGLAPYAAYISAALKNDIGITISYGAKSPGWPETKFPDYIDRDIEKFGVVHGGTIHAYSDLGKRTLEYSNNFLNDLDAEFGLGSFTGFNPENEHNENFGKHKLNIGKDLLFSQVDLLKNHISPATILLNSICIAEPWQQSSISVNSQRAVEIQKKFDGMHTRVGGDIYEESPTGRMTNNWYVDSLAGIEVLYGSNLLPTTQRRLSDNNIRFEVTEGCQLGDWVVEPRKHQPGSRIHAQYLLSRMGTKLIHSGLYTPDDPLLIRLWEMEPLLAAMQKDKGYFDTNDTLQLLQKINYRDFPS